jgi:mRNA-degrading endonuclease RelE of RelBE toxin-antitoxin system
MKPTINNIEKTVLEQLRLLSREKQEEVLDFVQFLLYKAQPTKQFSISSKSSTSPTETLHIRRGLFKILQTKPLSVSSESSTSPTEIPPLKRSLLDGEDYLIDPAITRSHDAFLKGYAPEDEGLYDDY